MFASSRKLLVIAGFTIVLILLVNLAWWVFYQRTADLLDNQLGRRLSALASAATVPLTPELIEGLLSDSLESYFDALTILEKIRVTDSLSEVFIVDEGYRYLATTSQESDSIYFLWRVNGMYIDSIIFGASALATTSYSTGDLYLKSAFAPLSDTSGYVNAVVAVEANVDYFDALTDLRNNLLYSTAISVAGGVVFGILFLLFQQRLNRTQQRLFLNETHAYLGRMAAVVSHEVKNPLMIIRASAERLKKKHGAEEAVFIIDEVDRLNQIVTGYLDVARAGAEGKSSDQRSLLGSSRPESIRLDNLTGDLRRQITQKFPDHQIGWIDSEPCDNPEMVGYPGPLHQVLLNLLTNAVDACTGAGKQISIGLSAATQGNTMILTVSDHGPGIRKRELARLFTPFYTSKQAGSGLGLYLSRKLVDEMGGSIDIESRVSEGTRVIIKLPLQAEV